jgi:arabinogalactan endo-1,4-beta-galactosidase
LKNKQIIKIFLSSFILFCLPLVNLLSQKAFVGTTMGFTGYLEQNCGIVYKENNEPADPFISLAEHGANIVRFRVGFPPFSSSYSNGLAVDHESPEMVKIGLQRAKDAGLKTLLTFSYQSFALEDSQKLNDYVAPLEWQSFASDINRLADSVYQYTYRILENYCSAGLIPEIVSIGNESVWRRLEPNLPENQLPAYSPQRSVTLHNAGSQAVRDISAKYNVPIKVAFHMMDPVKIEWWLKEHSTLGLNFDMMGISHYHAWTKNNYGSYASIGAFVAGIKSKYNIEVFVMETAQLYRSGGNDNHVDILGVENIPAGYPNSPTTDTQKKYLVDLTNEVLNNGGSGVITWGGEWVGSNCFIYPDKWGAGSSWENKTFWDFNTNLHDGVNWMIPFSGKVPVIFKVNMTGIDVSKGVYIKGDFKSKKGKTRDFIKMQYEGNNIYTHTSYIPIDSIGGYYFLNDSSESARENIPAACALQSGAERQFSIPSTSKGEAFISAWSGCDTIPEFELTTHLIGKGNISPSSGTYALNTDVTLTATPNPGWLFTGWSGDTSGTSNTLVIKMDSDKDITAKFTEKPKVVLTFKVDMTGISIVNGVYVTGEFDNLSGMPWVLNKMPINEGNNIYSYSTWAHVGESGAYYFLNANNWGARENVPGACLGMWNSDRKYIVNQNDTIFGYKWSSCEKIIPPSNGLNDLQISIIQVYPNPVTNREIFFHTEQAGTISFTFYDIMGRSVCSSAIRNNSGEPERFPIPQNVHSGFYFLDIQSDNKRSTVKLLVK